MNKKQTTKLIILIIAAIGGTNVYSATQVEQRVLSSVQPAVSIEKSATSVESGNVNPQTGVIDKVLSSVFTLQTNGTDSDYDFIITSSIAAEGGSVSAYAENGALLFGNISQYPTAAAITDAKSGGSNNKNVIAYQVTANVTTPMTIEYKNGYGKYGDCYVIKVNESNGGSITHILNQNPMPGSYSIQDQSGTYKSTVTFTAVSK